MPYPYYNQGQDKLSQVSIFLCVHIACQVYDIGKMHVIWSDLTVCL